MLFGKVDKKSIAFWSEIDLRLETRRGILQRLLDHVIQSIMEDDCGRLARDTSVERTRNQKKAASQSQNASSRRMACLEDPCCFPVSRLYDLFNRRRITMKSGPCWDRLGARTFRSRSMVSEKASM